VGTSKTLLLILAGYGLALAGGCAAVVLNELWMPEDISQGSGGMVAFGDMILFVLTTGVLALVPTWFLLKFTHEHAPRLLLAILALVAVTGPLSWALTLSFAGAPGSPDARQPGAEWIGLLIAFAAIPRIVAGPVVVAIEAAMLVLVRTRPQRAALVMAMLMDLVPLGLVVRHLARATH
jgi:hypothetical protein